MTENEPVAAARQPSFVWTIVIIIGTAFLSGMVAGYTDAMRDAGDATPSPLVAQGLVLALGGAVLAIYLSRFGRFWQSWSRRKQLYTVSLLIAASLGFLTTLALRLGMENGTPDDLFSSGRFNPAVAIALAVIWVGGMALSLALYHRNVDDHEKQAYLWGGLAGFYAIVFPAPVWWLLARAQMLPPVDGIILFLFSATVNAIVYMWLKYR
jgi:hypothetical protein